MTRNYFFSLLLFAGLVASSSVKAQTVAVTTTVANQSISGGNYVFDLYLHSTANAPLNLGTSDFIFTYDETQFTSPAISKVTPATTYCTFVPNTAAQAVQTQNNYYNALDQSLLGSEIRINLNLPDEPANASEFNENIAEIDGSTLLHRLGRFQISGVNASDVSSVALAWKSMGTGLVSQVFHFDNTGDFLLEETNETFEIDAGVCEATASWDGGAEDGLWTSATNWSNDILPGNCTAVTIANGDDVTLINSNVTIKSLRLDNNSKLTIENTGTLKIENSTAIGFIAVTSNDSLVNKGNLIIDTPTTYGIHNTGVIENQTGGTLNILNAMGNGFFHRGVFKNESNATVNITGSGKVGIRTGVGCSIINQGNLSIDNSEEAINNFGTIDNESNGLITIGQSTKISLLNNASGLINNYGDIKIANQSTGEGAILNNGTIINQSASALIQIKDPELFGLINGVFDNFTNHGIVTITNSSENGIVNFGNIINETTGKISIDTIEKYAFFNIRASALIENHGEFEISNTIDDGVFNNGLFKNKTNSILSIENTGDFGFSNGVIGLFENEGACTITNTIDHAIINSGTLNNLQNGLITVNNSSQDGILNNRNKTFTNDGTIIVNSPSKNGLINRGIFDNQSNGSLEINAPGATGIVNIVYNYLSNAGVISISNATLSAVSNSGPFTNTNTGNILINNSGTNGIINNSGYTFLNQGSISVDSSGITSFLNRGTLNTDPSSQLNLLQSDRFGMINWTNRTFNNGGTLTIENTVSSAISNYGIFNNNATGSVSLKHANSYGLYNFHTLNNYGSVTIDSTSNDAILNDLLINNEVSGILNINYSGDYGIYISTNKSLINKGVINITNSIDDGVYNNGNINNHANALINIHQSQHYGVYSNYNRVLKNDGTLKITNASSVGLYIRGTTTNNGTLHILDANGDALINTAIFNNNGTLEGNGNYRLANRALSGLVVPDTSYNKMTFFGNQEFLSSHSMVIEVGGITPISTHDVIEGKFGDMILAGNLATSFDVSYIPNDGDRVVFLEAKTITGNFNTLNPSLPAGWNIDYSISGEVALVYTTTQPKIAGTQNQFAQKTDVSALEDGGDGSISNKVLVFPNPIGSNLGKLSVQNNHLEVVRFTLFNSNGQLLKDLPIDSETTKTLDLKNIAPGFLIYKIETPAGIESGKLIVQ